MENLHLGTIGWSYNFWKGNFYPQKTDSKDFLAFYASKFGTVEVDSTFYRIPTEQTVINWKRQTPEGFLFSLKFPQLITHVKMLKGTQYETEIFLQKISLLGEKLGALLLQFPPNVAADHLPDLEAYLERLPKPRRYVVEIRNKSWLKDEFYSVLRKNQVALAWADSPLMAQIREMTADFLYVRWEGDRKKIVGTLGKTEADRTGDLQVEAEKLKPYLAGGTTVFGYFAKYYSGYPPNDIVTLQKNLGN